MLQGVPSVGQTVVAALLVQYLQDTDRSAIAIDCDPRNRALATFQAIGAETLDLSRVRAVAADIDHARLFGDRTSQP